MHTLLTISAEDESDLSEDFSDEDEPSLGQPNERTRHHTNTRPRDLRSALQETLHPKNVTHDDESDSDEEIEPVAAPQVVETQPEKKKDKKKDKKKKVSRKLERLCSPLLIYGNTFDFSLSLSLSLSRCKCAIGQEEKVEDTFEEEESDDDDIFGSTSKRGKRSNAKNKSLSYADIFGGRESLCNNGDTRSFHSLAKLSSSLS